MHKPETSTLLNMWETPNKFPLTSPAWSNTTVNSFGDMISAIDEHAGMTCYVPGKENKMTRITGCWESLQNTPLCFISCPYEAGCKVDFGNALCISRTQAPSLYRVLEAQALMYVI